MEGSGYRATYIQARAIFPATNELDATLMAALGSSPSATQDVPSTRETEVDDKCKSESVWEGWKWLLYDSGPVFLA